MSINDVFNSLPKDVRDAVKDTLSIYPKCSVYFENGKYHVTSATFVKKNYAEDFAMLGMFSVKDVFSPEEELINYVENFHSYPASYKGKRDYEMLKSLAWEDKVCLDGDGNIVKVGKKEEVV